MPHGSFDVLRFHSFLFDLLVNSYYFQTNALQWLLCPKQLQIYTQGQRKVAT